MADPRESAGRVLVVIPTLNEARTIEGVVRALSDDRRTDASTLFVVADGGSTDGTPAVVRRLMADHPNLRLLHNPKRIQSAAVNLAVQVYGQGATVLIRCDAHAVYPPGFVPRLLATLERTQADAVVVPMDSTGETCLQRAVAWVSDTPAGSGGSAHRGGRRSGFIDHGHHAAFRMESFRRAGGYDETFTHNEDAELDCRQRALGSRIWLDADIRLDYHPRSSLRGLWRQYFAYGRGRSRTARRHPGSLRLRQCALPLHVGFSLVALALAAWMPWLLAWPALYLAVLAAVSIQIAWRHRSACGLLAGAAAATMHGAWACGFLSGFLVTRERRWHPQSAQPLASGAAAPGGPA